MSYTMNYETCSPMIVRLALVPSVQAFIHPSFHLLSPGDLSPEELDYVCDYLQERVKTQETLEVDKFHLLYSVCIQLLARTFHERTTLKTNWTT